jgi:hypothetical protein
MDLRPVILLVLLLATCVPGPGFFFVRRFRWSAGEKLCASIGLSLVLLYLAATGIYLLRADWRWCWLTTAAFAGLTAASGRDLARLLRLRRVLRLLAGFGLLLAIGLALLSLIRNSSGGLWSGDPVEHHQRVEFFLQRLPHDTLFIDRYTLPARPPLMNLVTAYALAHVGGAGFDLFQVVFLFLNLLIFFPCALLAGLLVRRGSRRAWLVAAFLAASPVVLQNATWNWTKLLAAFFVLLSVALYVRGLQKETPSRIVAAAASMAAAALVHYSAGPYAVPLLCHYLCLACRGRRKPAEALGAAAVAAALLATWLAWSIAVYGVRETAGSNTTVSESRRLTAGENLRKIGGNVVATIVPHPLRLTPATFRGNFYQPNAFGFVRDYWFMICQVNLLFSIGLAGWLLAAWLMARSLRRPRAKTAPFWVGFAVAAALLGIAAHGPPDRFGVAHVSLQPLTLLALTLLAAGFPLLPAWARRAAAVAAVADVALGILLHFRIEMLDIRMFPAAGTLFLPLSRGLPNSTAVVNALDRHQRGLAYWGDRFAGVEWLPLVLALLLLGFALHVIATAASSGRSTPWQRPTRFTLLVLALFLGAAGGCLADRAAGFRVASSSGVSPGLSRPQVVEAVDPRLRAVGSEPDSARARYDLGAALYRLAQIGPAADAFLEAFLLDPGLAEARYALEIVLAANHLGLDDTDARPAEEVRLFPAQAAGHVGLAEQLLKRGHVEPARRRLLEALRLQPDSAGIADLLRSLPAPP